VNEDESGEERVVVVSQDNNNLNKENDLSKALHDY